MLRADLADGAPVATRAMQARAVQVVQAYSTSLKAEEFGEAFGAVSRLVAARDLVTALCAARCVSHLALLHLRGTAESAELSHVRGHSVLALGNAFALANRCESEECLRVDLVRSRVLDELYPFVVGPSFAAPPASIHPPFSPDRVYTPSQMCVSALVEANGLYLEPVLHAIAEQLPSLWDRARDSVPIHSCLISGEFR